MKFTDNTLSNYNTFIIDDVLDIVKAKKKKLKKKEKEGKTTVIKNNKHNH